MSAEHDKQFYNTFALILGALVVFTFVILFLAQGISASTADVYRAEGAVYQRLEAERIEPFGQVRMAGEAAPQVAQPEPEPTASAAASKSGEEVYNMACVACHGAGIAGAPKMGDAAAWADRIARGSDMLYTNAIDGYQGEAGYMPPKGGNTSLSDDEVRAAVDYMVEQSGG